MILLFTDFGYRGPYVGQMHCVLQRDAPGVPVIDLIHDAPPFNPLSSAYLLAALAPHIPGQSVCVAVVDPGVGTDRRALAIQADNRWFVGPDNGLFGVLPHVFGSLQYFEICWRPAVLSNSFHGRDLFAPVGAALACGEAGHYLSAIDPITMARPALAEIIYIDGFGNAMTGMPADTLETTATLMANGQAFLPATTFGDHPPGTPLWYENSLGLAELSVSHGSAAGSLALKITEPVYIR